MNNLALSEATPVGWVVYTLEGYDPEGGEVTFGLIGAENFAVDPKSGEVKVIKALDREVRTASYIFESFDKRQKLGLFIIYLFGITPELFVFSSQFNI